MNDSPRQPSEETSARIRMPSDMADLRTAFVDAEAEIARVIYGKETEIRLLMTALLSGSHVLIEDVPGTGKTTLAAALAAVTGLSYRRAQFTPDVMASDITGFHMYDREKGQFELHEGLVMCNLLLADEINRASPRTQSALLEAMEEGKVTVDGETLPLPDPFLVIATQNPTGYVGTYPLPEAQLDRFALRLHMGYPSVEEEIHIIRARKNENPLSSLRRRLSVETIRRARSIMANIHIDNTLYAYIVALVTATRRHPALSLGASPRASVTLVRLSQAYAFLCGRDYVLPEDIAALFLPAVVHRPVLRQDVRGEASVERILEDILKTTEVPYCGSRRHDDE